jgi:chorismate synthase
MSIRYLTAGESHGPGLTAILEGMPAGLAITEQIIDFQLARRQAGYGAGPRMKLERDHARILGGVMEGLTTGAPIAIFIENLDHAKWKGKAVEGFTTPRPGHVDLAGVIKYGYNDIRPALERASARETAARVAVGTICRHLLAQFGIQIGGYVSSIGEITGSYEQLSYQERFERAEESDVRCPDEEASEQMRARVREIMQERDTLGGVVEVVALGLPPGLGSHVQPDRRLEARLGAAILSVQAMKGVEFGPAFDNTRLPGTRVHDAIIKNDGWLSRPTDRAGGTEGGISTGQPLVVRAAMKPIATTLNPQKTVDLATSEEVDTKYERSDFCPVPRAVPVLEAVVAFVLADAMLEKLGGDSLSEILPRFGKLRQARLDDILMENRTHIFWPDQEG